MSLSNMNKSEYRKVRALIRANGFAYAVKHIECPLMAQDMRDLEAPKMYADWLAERANFQRLGDSGQSAFMLTTWTTIEPKIKFVAPLP